jgi:hypothetical protein
MPIWSKLDYADKIMVATTIGSLVGWFLVKGKKYV